MSISIGDIKLRNRVLLAPMSGVSDRPFREIADLCKAGLVVTEMVASRELAAERADMVRRAERPVAGSLFAVQLAGREAQWMAEGRESRKVSAPTSSTSIWAVRQGR